MIIGFSRIYFRNRFFLEVSDESIGFVVNLKLVYFIFSILEGS
jgi:hypothetical protein